MNLRNLAAIFFLVMMFSCKERIDIALAEDVDKLIIEGEVHDGAGPYFVKISRSTNFGNSVTFLPHAPLSVFISDNAGNRDSLVKHADGMRETCNSMKLTVDQKIVAKTVLYFEAQAIFTLLKLMPSRW